MTLTERSTLRAFTPQQIARALASANRLPWSPNHRILPVTVLVDRTVAHATVGPVTVLTEDAKPKRISRTMRRIG